MNLDTEGQVKFLVEETDCISTCTSSVCRQMLLLRVELAATGSGFVFILGPNAAETSAKGILALV